ncbi:MAG: hypothetical protein ABID04_00595 [Patescibacteria group bacterium]
MKKKTISLSFLALVLFGLGLTLLSKDSLAVAEDNPSPTPEGTVSGVLDDKIDDLREEVRKKVEEKLKNIVDQQTKRGWIGTVEKKDKLSFTLKTNNQPEPRQVNISEDLEVVDDSRKELTFDQITEGQRVIAMGYLQADGSLEAKRIVLIDKAEDRGIEAVFGTITDVSTEKQILSITPLSDIDNAYEVIIDSKSTLRQRTDGDSKKTKYADLQADQKVVAVLSLSKDNGTTLNAKTMLIVSSLPEPSPTPTEAEVKE